MASEITERTGKPKDKIKNASKVIRTDTFMEDVQKCVCLYGKYSRDFKDRNMKVNCWEKVASKFDSTPPLNSGMSEQNTQKKKKTVPSGSGREASEVFTEFEKLGWLSSYIDHKTFKNRKTLSDCERPSATLKGLSDCERPSAIVKD